MRRACLAGFLLLWGSYLARAGSHGAVFAYEGNVGDVAVLRPMMSPRIGVQLMEGPREINAHEIMVCKSGVEQHSGTIDGQPAVVSIFTLTCDKRKFAVKSVAFEESLE